MQPGRHTHRTSSGDVCACQKAATPQSLLAAPHASTTRISTRHQRVQLRNPPAKQTHLLTLRHHARQKEHTHTQHVLVAGCCCAACVAHTRTQQLQNLPHTTTAPKTTTPTLAAAAQAAVLCGLLCSVAVTICEGGPSQTTQSKYRRPQHHTAATPHQGQAPAEVLRGTQHMRGAPLWLQADQGLTAVGSCINISSFPLSLLLCPSSSRVAGDQPHHLQLLRPLARLAVHAAHAVNDNRHPVVVLLEPQIILNDCVGLAGHQAPRLMAENQLAVVCVVHIAVRASLLCVVMGCVVGEKVPCRGVASVHVAL